MSTLTVWGTRVAVRVFGVRVTPRVERMLKLPIVAKALFVTDDKQAPNLLFICDKAVRLMRPEIT